MVVAPDRRTAVVGSYQVLGRPSPGPHRLRLRGLDPAAVYRVSAWPGDDDIVARANTGERTGAELMAAGLRLDLDRFEAATLRRLLGAPVRARGALTGRPGGSTGRDSNPRRVQPFADPSVRPRTNCFESTR